jgi:hypothetical protein
MNILKYKWREGQAAVKGIIKSVISPLTEKVHVYDYYNIPNEESYVVESPDAIIPADSCAYTAFRYPENDMSAGIVFNGSRKDNYKTVVLGFPFESIKTARDRDTLMESIIRYFYKEEN